MQTAECPRCNSGDTRKDGVYRYKERVLQRYECKACGRKFNEKSGSPFHGLHYAPAVVVLALMLQVQFGVSGSGARLISGHVWGLRPHRRTLERWVTRFSPHLVQLEDRLRPRFTDVWMIDELFCNRHAHNSKRKPCPKYLFTVLDSLRQVVACLVSDHRDVKSVMRVVRLALKRSSVKPRVISRDGAPIYDGAKNKLRTTLGECRWQDAHFKAVAIPVTERYEAMSRRRGPVRRIRRRVVRVTQNHIERYHCFPRARENSMRGVKTARSGTAYFQALGVANNLFKPHEAHGGVPPAVAAGWSPGLTWASLPKVL